MLNISNAFKQELFNDNRAYLCYADITLTNGTVLNITNTDIWANGFQFEEAVSATDDFSIGSVIVGQFILTLNNIYEKFSEHNFEGATVIAYIGLKLPNGTTEKIRKGTYFVDEPAYNGTTITLNCLDYLAKLDRPYTESILSYPATLQQIVQDACSVCGITLLTTTFDNGTYTVQSRPDDDALTFREVIGFAAQIACKWVKVDVYGRLSLEWYAQGLIDRGGLDGGIFDEDNPYSTGDDADGGLFNPWDVGYVMDGGTFNEQNEYHHIYSMSSMKVGTDDVVITGVQVTDSSEDEETYLYGNEGYVIAIEGNDFIQSGNAQEVATFIGNQIIGFRFRAFDISHLNDPSIESGDLVYITDRKQNTYLSMITNTSFKVGQYQNSSCGAKSVSKNSAAEYSITTKSIVKSRKEAQKQITEYDKAVQQLTSLITQSFGVYKTEEVLEDGSTIYYMHNKPTLAESQTVWKMTADAFAVSTDGGKTWNAGMDSQGNAVLNVLSTVGINFDWARGGTLALGGQNNGNGVCQVMDAGGSEVVRLDNAGIKILKGLLQIGTLFSVDTAGNVVANSLKSSNAEITGGSINIETESDDYNAITLKFMEYVLSLSASMVQVYDIEHSGCHASLYCGSAGTGGSIGLGDKPGSEFFVVNGSNLWYEGPTAVFEGDLHVYGNKNRIVKTEKCGERALNSYETAEAYFGDIGTEVIPSSGICWVEIEPIFSETVSLNNYVVFLQAEGQGECYVKEKRKEKFAVCGTPGMVFAWEIKAKQKGFENVRLDEYKGKKEK